MGSRGGEDSPQGGGWQSGQSHIQVQINWEEQLGSETDAQPRVPVWGNKASKSLTETPVGVEEAVGETFSLTGEFVGETHRVLELSLIHI